MENILWVWQSTVVDCKTEYTIYFISINLYL